MRISSIIANQRTPQTYSFTTKYACREGKRKYMSRDKKGLETMRKKLVETDRILCDMWQDFKINDELERKIALLHDMDALKAADGSIRKCKAEDLELLQKGLLFDTEEEFSCFVMENKSDSLLWSLNLRELADMGGSIQLIEKELEKRDKIEMLSLTRLMRETGIRLMDAVELTKSNLNDREVICIERKRGNTYYQNRDGSYPAVSTRTRCLLRANEDGRFFAHKAEYYRRYLNSIEKMQSGKYFRYYDLRCYWRTRNDVLRRASWL